MITLEQGVISKEEEEGQGRGGEEGREPQEILSGTFCGHKTQSIQLINFLVNVN